MPYVHRIAKQPTPLQKWIDAAPKVHTLAFLEKLLRLNGVTTTHGRLSEYRSGQRIPGPKIRHLLEILTLGIAKEDEWIEGYSDGKER